MEVPKHVALVLRNLPFTTSTISYSSYLFQAGAPLFRQLTNAYSEENALEDTLYFLGRALGEGVLDCDGYLKQVCSTWKKKMFKDRKTNE